MVTITINGKKQEREFQNMAQALAFAYQNGECYAAEKVELVSSNKEPRKETPEKSEPATGKPEGIKEAGFDNTAQA